MQQNNYSSFNRGKQLPESIILGPIVAKTISHRSTTTYSSQITREKHNQAIVANNIPRTTMNPQHTILNAIIGELAQTRKWEKEQTPNLYVREKDAVNQNCEWNYGHDSTIE